MSKKEEPANNQAPNAANQEKEPELLDFKNLKAGDYFIHVYIEETRGLIHHRDNESTVDPIIKVETCGRNKTTKRKDDIGTGMTYWGEHIFFEVKFDEAKEIETQKLKLSVIDHNLIGFDALIGEFEIDLTTIYLTDNHSYLHKWVALSNIQKEYSVIKGFLKFSVNIAGPGDDQVKLEDEKIQADTTLHRDESGKEKAVVGPPQVLLPPQLQTKPWQLEIQLVRAQNLPIMDMSVMGGSIDCYIVFEFAGSKFVTNIVKKDQNPVWSKRIFLPYYEPTVTQFLNVKVYDWDSTSKDDIVGSFNFRYDNAKGQKTIRNGDYKKLFWMNIYGSQVDSNEKYSAIMNTNPDLGTFWKGRIQLSIICKEAENPKLGSEGLEKKDSRESVMGASLMDWRLMIELLYGCNFKEKNGKYSILVRWADQELAFEGKGKDGIWEWFEKKTLDVKFPYENSEEMPDIFIYLVYDKKKIAYIRRTAKFFQQMMADDPQIFYFKVDRSIDEKMRDDEAGYVKMRLTIGDKVVLSNLWNKALTKPFCKEGFLYVNLFYGQDLLPADSDGNSDPKVVVSYYGRTVTSEVINDTLNPIWYQRLELQVPMFKLEETPPLLLNVYDYDFGSGDDFIGSVVVDLNEAFKNGYAFVNKNETPKPEWFPIKYHRNSESGRLLVSFNLYEQKPVLMPQIYPEMEKYNCKIRIVGMRGLQSLGLLPVKRAFIKFDINSLRTRDEKQALREKGAIVTEPKESGQNPNISTIINFSLNLPKDVDLCPSLSCTVHDYILKGLSQPVLGVFSINLKEYILKTRLNYQKSISMFNKRLSKGLQIHSDLEGVSLVNLIQASKGNDPEHAHDHDHDNKHEEHKHGGEKESVIEIPSISKEPKMQEIPGYKPLVEDSSIVDKSNVEINLEAHPHEKLHGAHHKEVIDDEGRIHSHLIIIKPVYYYDAEAKDVREKDVPDLKKYMTLGWDPKGDRLNKNKPPKKHYRYIVNDELENSKFMDKNTFDEFKIFRTQRGKTEGYFSILMGKPFIPKQVGRFKCWVDILSDTEEKSIKAAKASALLPGLMGKRGSEVEICDTNKLNKNIDNEFLVKRDVMVRVYIISVDGLPAMDSGSLSDPYVQLRIAGRVINNQKDYQKDKANANFHTMFELKSSLPGNSLLHIEVWDYDSLVSDDLIGETVIDLENRFFSKTWRALEYYPVEVRELNHPDSKASRGTVTMWCEIIDLTDKEAMHEVWDIKPKPSMDYELRAVVWECEDVPNNDIEDASDLYVTGRLGDKTLKTDVHYRSQNGIGSFNWRMVWPIMLPTPDPTLTFQIWDKDFLSGNDFISDVSFSFAKQAEDAFENDSIVKIFGSSSAIENVKDGLDKGVTNFTGDLTGKNNNPPSGKKAARREDKFTLALNNVKKSGYSTLKNVGKLTLSFELVPGSIAKVNKVGMGRGEPNHDPWLPPPVGRFEWSWNPITLFNRCVGPKARWKICCAIWIIICCAIMISLAPIIIGNAVGNILSK